MWRHQRQGRTSTKLSLRCKRSSQQCRSRRKLVLLELRLLGLELLGLLELKIWQAGQGPQRSRTMELMMVLVLSVKLLGLWHWGRAQRLSLKRQEHLRRRQGLMLVPLARMRLGHLSHPTRQRNRCLSWWSWSCHL